MGMFKPSHPGRILKAHYLDPLNLTITEAAKGLGITRPALSAIVNGRAGISVEMALRLAEAFNTTPELWINMQKNFDLWEASQKRSRKTKVVHFYKTSDLAAKKSPKRIIQI